MKKIKYILIAACIATLSSCDYEPKVFDNENGKTLTSFSSLSYNLPIVIDATGTADVQVNVSTVSSTDRTFNIEVDADNTTAIMGSYSVPSTVTVPAGEYSGTLTLSGTDVPGVETTPETLALNIVSGDGFAVGPTALVNVFQVCPVDNSFFTGDYQMTHLVFNGFGVPTFGFGKIVTLANDNGNTIRSFDAPYGPDLGAFSSVTWTFNLSCNEVSWDPDQDAAVGCGGAANGNIELHTADAAFGNGTYDPVDDSTFTMNFVDDNTDDCGARTNVSILMTKQ